MIVSFGDKITEAIFHGDKEKYSKKWNESILPSAVRKLDLLNSASILTDLLSPPGNKLEKLKGTMSDFYSIRVNNQYRIIFIWNDGHAENVRLTDYH
jgi:proteic killer suppression protein